MFISLQVIVKIIHVYPFDAASHVNCSTESCKLKRAFMFISMSPTWIGWCKFGFVLHIGMS